VQHDQHDGRGAARCEGRAPGRQARPACDCVTRTMFRCRSRLVSTDGHGVLTINAGPGIPCASRLGVGDHRSGGPAGTEPDGRARCRAKPHRSGRVGGRGTRHHPAGVYDAAPSRPRPGVDGSLVA
jgi:hypothetical protein